MSNTIFSVFSSDQSDFEIRSGQVFTLGPSVGSYSLSIDIIDDDVFEAKYEFFTIGLSANETEVHGLQFLNASLTINDNDSKLSVFQLMQLY